MRGGPETAGGWADPFRVSLETPAGLLETPAWHSRRGGDRDVSCAIMRSSKPEEGVWLAYALASRQEWGVDASE